MKKEQTMNWVIEENYNGKLLRDYLRKKLSFSNSVLKAIKFDGGQLLVNGQNEDVRYRLSAGDDLTVVFPPEERGFYMTPENIPLSIVYEDDYILIIDKQPGIVAMPTPHTPSGTIANGILAYYDKLKLPFTVHIVTRLDRNTSGLMLVAKHRYIHSLLAKTQQEGHIFREYRTVAKGELAKKSGVIDLPIGRKAGSIIERTVVETGRPAITEYEVLEEYNDYSLVKAILKTGRTHQIRVHFSSIGHPVIGDDLYGDNSTMLNRHALHCYKLQFTHPITKELITKISELPEDMGALLLNDKQ